MPAVRAQFLTIACAVQIELRVLVAPNRKYVCRL